MTRAKILSQSPVLFARDLPAAVEYWAQKVGFDKHGVFGEPPVFAIMKRDNAFVMLKQAPAGHKIVPYWEISENLWNAYFWVDDVDTLFKELQERGAVIDYELCNQPYGVREFGIQDLERNDIGFGQVMAPASGGKR